MVSVDDRNVLVRQVDLKSRARNSGACLEMLDALVPWSIELKGREAASFA